MPAHNRKGRSKNGPPFIQLFRVVKRSAAYHGLSVYARAAMIEMLDRFSGYNNGFISLSVRELATELCCGHDKASQALRELDDAGLVQPSVLGVWRGKRATQWRITFYKCDRTGDLPNRNFKPRPSPSSGTQSPRSGTQGNSQSALRNAKAEKLNKPAPAQSALRNAYTSSHGGTPHTKGQPLEHRQHLDRRPER